MSEYTYISICASLMFAMTSTQFPPTMIVIAFMYVKNSVVVQILMGVFQCYDTYAIPVLRYFDQL